MFWSCRLTIAESSDWQVHEVFELMFCHSGAGRVLVDKHEFDLRPYRMILIVPGARHRVIFDGGQSADLKIVCVTAQDTAEYLSPVQAALLQSLQNLGCSSSDRSTEIPLLAELVQLIPEGSVVGDGRELLKVWSVISLLLASHVQEGFPTIDGPQRQHKSKMQDICARLDQHLDQESNLDEIASDFGLSRSLLTRAFRRHTGTTIVHYVNARRLEKAAVLLTSSTERSITQAAFESGFSNLSNFHRRFKAAYGFTPAEFRRNFTNA
jgi:AraC family transcriptional activator of mar-sox-rob regulon